MSSNPENDDQVKKDNKKKKRLWPLVLLNFVLLLILIFIIFLVFFKEDSRPAVSHLPAFGMQSAMGGGTFDSDDLITDNAFMLNIFASWCKPCEAEHPVLSDLVYKHNIPLYGIALKDDEADLKAFLKRLGNPYHDIGMDNAGLMLSGLGIGGVPATLVIDSNLKIHMIHEGPVTEQIAQEKILPLIKKLNN